jgi:hypothetical protein
LREGADLSPFGSVEAASVDFTDAPKGSLLACVGVSDRADRNTFRADAHFAWRPAGQVLISSTLAAVRLS